MWKTYKQIGKIILCHEAACVISVNTYVVEVLDVTVVSLLVVVDDVLEVDVTLDVELVLEVDDVELVEVVVDVVVSARLVMMNSTTREKPWGVPLSTT